MVNKASEEKYRLVVEVGGKIFKDTKIVKWHGRRHLANEVKRLNQLVGVSAHIETISY